MVHRWDLRSPEPRELFTPVPVDPTGVRGPTRAQARGPRWRRTGPNRYVPADVARSRVEQRIVEQWARMPPGTVVSGWAALRMHRVNFCDGLDPDLAELPVPVLLRPTTSARAGGVQPHREPVPDGERTERYGVACATPERALFDAMKWAGDLREAVAVADMTFAARALSRSEFQEYVGRRTGAKGAVAVADALPLTEARSRSPQETRMRLIWLLDARLPRPLCNWPVHDADRRRIGRPDLLCVEHGVVGEFDGADHRGIDRHAGDVTKESAYRDAGLECFRIVGRDLLDANLVVGRMKAAVRRAREAPRPRRWSIPDNPGPL